MADHPQTIDAEPTGHDGIDWDDHATIHRADDGGGIFDPLKAIHRGTLAQMVAMLRAMPEDERGQFVIEKAGDSKLTPDQVEALAAREDFPG